MIQLLVQIKRQGQDPVQEWMRLSLVQSQVLEMTRMQSAPSLRRGSEAIFDSKSESTSGIDAPQSKEGIAQVLQEISSSSTQGTQLAARGTPPTVPPLASLEYNSTHILVVPIVEILLRWCVEGMKKMYGVMDSLKSRVSQDVVLELNGILGAPEQQASFDRYQLEQMTQPAGLYILTLVWELYAYASMVYLVTPTKERVVEQPQLTHTLVRDVS